MSRNALVMFAVSSLLGCGDVTEPPPSTADEVRVEVGDAWSAPRESFAEGAYVEVAFDPLVIQPTVTTPPIAVVHGTRGPYLTEASPAAIGLLELVNTATAAELDQVVPASEEATVGRLIQARPFQTVAALQDVPAVDHETLDGLLQHALLHGFVDSFDHQEVILSLANEVAANGWDLSQSLGNRLQAVDEAEAEEGEGGALVQEMRTLFRQTHDVDAVALSVDVYAIQAYRVPVGYVVVVATNDASVERFGTHYFVDATSDAEILVQADFVAM